MFTPKVLIYFTIFIIKLRADVNMEFEFRDSDPITELESLLFKDELEETLEFSSFPDICKHKHL